MCEGEKYNIWQRVTFPDRYLNKSGSADLPCKKRIFLYPPAKKVENCKKNSKKYLINKSFFTKSLDRLANWEYISEILLNGLFSAIPNEVTKSREI